MRNSEGNICSEKFTCIRSNMTNVILFSVRAGTAQFRRPQPLSPPLYVEVPLCAFAQSGNVVPSAS